jgi:hypothetical protein
MSIDDDADEPAWGTPQPSPKRWGTRETVVAVGVAVVIAAFGGGAIYAATANSQHQQPFSHTGRDGPAQTPGGQQAAAPLALHGELVVPDGAGGYTTVLTQRGHVLEMSTSAITVRSDDGYTQTYVLPTAVADDLSVVTNDEVSVEATRTGPTATATGVTVPQDPGGPGGPPGPAVHN